MPSNSSLEICHEDDHIVIVNKPAGLLSVPGKTEPHCLHSLALNYNANCRVVHRLDMATSGLVIFAKSHAAQKAMGHLFERREVHKQYLAVVAGHAPENSEINQPLICDWPNRPKQKICHETGKPSRTLLRCIKYFEDAKASLVELTPITGRSHQLRVHCWSLKHPILGDKLYNIAGSDRHASRLLLNAERLEFEHPITKEKIHVIKQAGFERPHTWLTSD